MSLLVVEGATVHHRDRLAVRAIDITVPPGAAVALLGANGAGKSSLLRALMGLIPLSGGRILFDGEDITRRPAAYRARAGIGYCPEGRRPFPGLSVRENLAVACWADRRERARRIEATLAAFPALRPHADRPAGQLSGGQQQMLAIGRALMDAPRLVLLDEPTLGLAPLVVEAVLARVPEIVAGGASVLLAEQSLRALSVCATGVVLADGRVRQSGPATALAASGAIEKSFLGG